LFSNVEASVVLELVNRATGFDYSLDELPRAGERAWNVKRAINVRLGLERKDDRLPGHLLRPLPEGGSAGFVPPLEEMLAAYYAYRGWDPVSGRPSRDRLLALGLAGISQDLWGDPGPPSRSS
jgi:aldehyde:ferredoxin oxidoreductase